jgi:predicted TIM-barrel fold metal-dependent hydrolase
MFGSDYSDSIVTNIKSYIDAYKKAIPERHWRAVFSENAACVYKFNKRFPADFGKVDCSKL